MVFPLLIYPIHFILIHIHLLSIIYFDHWRMAPRTEGMYSMLTDQDSWQVWYDSIQNLASIHFVWEYCDPDGTREATAKSSESIRTGIRKVLEQINITVTPKHRIFYQGCRTPREQLAKLRMMVEPTIQDRKDSVRHMYDILIKGPKQVGTESWLGDWLVIVVKANQIGIENLSEHQICQGFIEASKEINPAFFNQMKSQTAMRRQHEQAAARERLVDERLKEMARMLKVLADSRDTPTDYETPEPDLDALLE